MADVASMARQVQDLWTREGVGTRPIAKDDVRLAEARLARELPHDYKAFLHSVGLPNDEGGDGFRFWPPSELRLTGDVLRDAGYASRAREESVVFADYLQESWWYAIWVVGPDSGCVSLVLGTHDELDPQPPIGTFHDFLAAYLADAECLYPRPLLFQREREPRENQ